RVTGQPSTFATLPNAPDQDFNNQYPGLGNIAFDCNHQQFCVSNFEDGKIYRLDMNGVEKGPAHDHGDDDPGGDGWVNVGDLVWGLQVHGGRLYYSVWRTHEDSGTEQHNQI